MLLLAHFDVTGHFVVDYLGPYRVLPGNYHSSLAQSYPRIILAWASHIYICITYSIQKERDIHVYVYVDTYIYIYGSPPH